ncbi:MAG: hypothetical protein LBT78_08005 [Tannerella sp.]|nr:hypothetical protein [Tannerella sp.]
MLVVLFLSYYMSATSFYHTHYYSWGIVTHSHFYFPLGDNPAQHHHTQSQCQTIQLLSQIILTGFIAAVFLKIAQIKRIYIPVRHYKFHLLLIALPLRAPPVLN